MKKYVLWSVLCLVVLTGFGCAASREAGGLSGPEFPTIKEIQKVKIKAKKETQTVDVFQESAVSLSGWKVLDGAPTRIDETPSSSGENPLMSEVFSIVSKRPGALHVQEMDCIAREYARLAADEVKPSLAWTRFVHARCGAVLSNRVATIGVPLRETGVKKKKVA